MTHCWAGWLESLPDEEEGPARFHAGLAFVFQPLRQLLLLLGGLLLEALSLLNVVPYAEVGTLADETGVLRHGEDGWFLLVGAELPHLGDKDSVFGPHDLVSVGNVGLEPTERLHEGDFGRGSLVL